MGRGRSGGTTTSIRKAEHNSRRYITKIYQQPNWVTGYLVAQLSIPRERSLAWGHRKDNT